MVRLKAMYATTNAEIDRQVDMFLAQESVWQGGSMRVCSEPGTLTHAHEVIRKKLSPMLAPRTKAALKAACFFVDF